MEGIIRWQVEDHTWVTEVVECKVRQRHNIRETGSYLGAACRGMEGAPEDTAPLVQATAMPKDTLYIAVIWAFLLHICC